MVDSKIISIGSANDGLKNLYGKSAKTKSIPNLEAPQEDVECFLLHVPLQNKTYFVPFASFGVIPPRQEMPVVVFSAEVAYSEFSPPNTNRENGDLVYPLLSVQRHSNVQIAATGIVTEIVKVPSWWSKRDEGGF